MVKERNSSMGGKRGKLIKILGGVVGLLAVVIVVFGIRARLVRNGRVEGAIDSSNEVISAEVGRSFMFGAMNNQGEVDGEVTLRIVSAEKTDEVLIQGKPAKAKGEKIFLVLNLEIDNQQAETRYIMPVDLIRLKGEGGKLFAPDVHSEVVEIRPLSTKITRVGFVVSGNEKLFEVLVGELEGGKQSVEITFSK